MSKWAMSKWANEQMSKFPTLPISDISIKMYLYYWRLTTLSWACFVGTTTQQHFGENLPNFLQEPDEARYYQDGEQEGDGEGEVIKGVRTNLIVSQDRRQRQSDDFRNWWTAVEAHQTSIPSYMGSNPDIPYLDIVLAQSIKHMMFRGLQAPETLRMLK